MRSPTARSYPDRIPRVPVGPLAPTVLGECSSWSIGQGYSPGSAAGIVNLLERLSLWMRAVGAGVDDIDEELLAGFVAAERSRDVVCVSVKSSMGAVRRFLMSGGYLGVTQVEADQLTAARAAVADWGSWMRDQRGLTEKTIAARRRYAAGLLDVLTAADGAVAVVSARHVDRQRVRRRTRTPLRRCCSRSHRHAVRCLLRWALSTGRLDRDLTAGILKPAGTRRSLPRGVAAEQVAALLAGVIRPRRSGRGTGRSSWSWCGWAYALARRPVWGSTTSTGRVDMCGSPARAASTCCRFRSMWARRWRRGCGFGRPRWTGPCSCGSERHAG